jgi:UTP--glucose-1-phosphate uridylyltransferase
VLYQGRPIIAEHFRLPRSFDPEVIPVFNTNTFLVDSHALAELKMEWTYVEVKKQVAERTAVQFERLLGEITMTLRPRFVTVSRTGDASRFLPMKSHDDLESARASIAALMRRLGLAG